MDANDTLARMQACLNTIQQVKRWVDGEFVLRDRHIESCSFFFVRLMDGMEESSLVSVARSGAQFARDVLGRE